MHDKKRLHLALLISSICLFAPSSKAETLEDTLLLVYQTNPSIEAERAKLRAVDEQVSQALSYWRPSIDAQAYTGGIYQNTPNNLLVQPASETLNTNSVGVQVTQPIFRGFRTVAGVKAAEKQIESERATLDNIEQQVFLETATAYLDVMRDEAIVELNKHFQQALNGKLGEAEHRFSAHDVTRTDVDQATARLKRSEAGRMQADANLASHRATFYQLTGQMPGSLKEPKLDLPPIKDLDEAIALTRRQNPAVKAAGSNEDEAREEVTVNQGSLLPEVNLVGSGQRQWGVSDLIPGRQDTAQVLLQLTVPLYRTGADYSKTRAALQTVTERRMRLEETRRQAEQLIIAAWQNLATLKSVVNADKVESEAAEKALSGVMKEFPAGTRDTLDILNAEQEVMDARVGLAQAQHDEAIMVLQIRAAIGALTARALKLPIPLYDPSIHYEATRSKLIGFETPDGEPEAKDVDPSEDVKPSRLKEDFPSDHSENFAPALAFPPDTKLKPPSEAAAVPETNDETNEKSSQVATPLPASTLVTSAPSERSRLEQDVSVGRSTDADITVAPAPEKDVETAPQTKDAVFSDAKGIEAPTAPAVDPVESQQAQAPVPAESDAPAPSMANEIQNSDTPSAAIIAAKDERISKSVEAVSTPRAETEVNQSAKVVLDASQDDAAPVIRTKVSDDVAIAPSTPNPRSGDDEDKNTDNLKATETTASWDDEVHAKAPNTHATSEGDNDQRSSARDASSEPTITLPARQKDGDAAALKQDVKADYPSQDHMQNGFVPVAVDANGLPQQ